MSRERFQAARELLNSHLVRKGTPRVHRSEQFLLRGPRHSSPNDRSRAGQGRMTEGPHLGM